MSLRLLSYARVSDVRGREGPGFISPTEQFSRNRSYCDAYGHQVVEEGIDLDRSGGDMSRPVFDAFLARIKNGEADGLIVAKLDRFARSNLGALQAIESIEDAGGALISVQEQIDPRSASGRFMRSIFLATAQMERERIGEQWFAARSSAVKRGIHVAPHVPPGYSRGGRTSDASTDRILAPHPTHADTIREAFQMAARGDSYADIAAYLNLRKLPTTSVKNGERETNWTSHRVSRVLANRAYLGEARSGPGIENGGAHEALVDEQTFALAQARRGRAANRTATNYLLSGIARCASCSHAMRAQPARGTTQAAYRCATTLTTGRCPAPTTIAMDRLERFVLADLAEMAAGAFAVQAVEEDSAEIARRVVSTEASYRAQLKNLELRRTIGDVDHDELVAALHGEWITAVAELERSRPQPFGFPAGTDVASLLADASFGELRTLVGSAVQAVFVRPAASRARNLPVSDRVKVSYVGDGPLEIPRRGERFAARRVDW